jgi:hypothetical protein
MTAFRATKVGRLAFGYGCNGGIFAHTPRRQPPTAERPKAVDGRRPVDLPVRSTQTRRFAAPRVIGRPGAHEPTLGARGAPATLGWRKDPVVFATGSGRLLRLS